MFSFACSGVINITIDRNIYGDSDVYKRQSLTNATLAIAVVSIPSYVRLTRAAVLNEKNRDYVTSSRVAGASVLRLMFIVILPNCLAPLIVQMTMGISNAILELATLGFLGIGAKPPTPELGTMLSESRSFMQAANWLVTIPGLVILSLVLAFNLMGDGLDVYKRQVFNVFMLNLVCFQ